MSDRPLVQIAGMPRTGTRYLAKLLRFNFDVETTNRGKHAFPDDMEREPYQVALVIAKRFDYWLSSRIRAEALWDNEKRLEELFTKGYERYKWFYHLWLKAPRTEIVQYEKLLQDPEAYLTTLAEHWGWRRLGSSWVEDGPYKLPEWRRMMYIADESPPK